MADLAVHRYSRSCARSARASGTRRSVWAPEFDLLAQRRTKLARISDVAISLLRRDYETEEEQLKAVRWAEREFDSVGLWPVVSLNDDDPENILFNLIEENVLLPDWIQAREISEESVLDAEDFRTLIAR